MKELPPAKQAYNLWVLLSQTRNAILRVRQKELDRSNISVAQAAILFAIRSIGDKATPAEIARCILRTPHSVSVVLSRMEKKGLVSKAKDLDRKNLVRVMLTEKGLKAIDHQSNKPESILRIMSDLSDEERQQLGLYLQELRDKALKELGVELKIPFPPWQ